MSRTAADASGRFVVTVLAAARPDQPALAAAWLAQTAGSSRAIVAEGAAVALPAPDGVVSVALGAGCPCCIGQVALRAGLTRLWREHRSTQTLLLVSDRRHLHQLAERLAATPFGVEVEVRITQAADAG